jgi:hypothetical protein
VRQELSSIIRVEGANDAFGCLIAFSFVVKVVELRHVVSNLARSLALLLQEVDGDKARVVVHKHEHVLVSSHSSTDEGADNVRVNEPANAARLVWLRVVSKLTGIGLDAVSTRVRAAVGYLRGHVCGQCTQLAECVLMDVEAAMEGIDERVGTGSAEVRSRLSTMSCLNACGTDLIRLRDMRFLWHRRRRLTEESPTFLTVGIGSGE